MVNYKRMVCEVALLGAVATLFILTPVHCADHHYDQRQNGSENYRLNIDGVFIAVVPADSIPSAASDVDFGELLALFDDSDKIKPTTSQKPPSDVKPEDSKPQEGLLLNAAQLETLDSKPEVTSIAPETPLSDVTLSSEDLSQKKEATNRKQEKTHRLKNRLANILMPFLRRTRRH